MEIHTPYQYMIDTEYWGSIADIVIASLTFLGFTIAYFKFTAYRKEVSLNRFIEMRRHFKSDTNIRTVLNFILSNDISNDKRRKVDVKERLDNRIPTALELIIFLGFYEDLHKLKEERQVSVEDIHYFFGYYLLLFFNDPFCCVSVDIKSSYWDRVSTLYKEVAQIEENIKNRNNTTETEIKREYALVMYD